MFSISQSKILQLGQGDLGLQETEYYNNDSSTITIAYRQFMTDLATALTNDTSAIAVDVQAIYELEKNISQVCSQRMSQKIRSDLFLLVPLERCTRASSR